MSSLGSGASGQVFRAISRKTSKQVAIKVVENQFAYGHLVNDGKNEYELLKKANHNNVVKLRAIFSNRRAVYIVMDLAICDVHKLIGNHELAELDAKAIARQACDGLRYLHDLRIIHIDVKPGNILVYSLNPALVKLTDFGLSRIVTGDTALQTLCSTPAFATPEVVLCGYSWSEHYDEKVDAFSMGVTIFNMITAQFPWNDVCIQVDPTGVGLDRRELRWCGELRDYAKDIITRLLARSPKDRLAAAEAISHDWFQDADRPVLTEKAEIINPLGLPASTLCSTPAFATPEVVLCGYSWSEHYDEKVDAFSMGVTIFNMITAQFPWNDVCIQVDPTGVGLDRRELRWCGELRDYAKDIITRLLARSPKDRLAAAEAISHDWFQDADRPVLTEKAEIINPLGLPASLLLSLFTRFYGSDALFDVLSHTIMQQMPASAACVLLCMFLCKHPAVQPTLSLDRT
ncbi:uncharacterized protein PHACADRAFT_201749 [Phanerochaete carnosa HHB-10118-sp]|uniref:Protein kinase domain-containing protein n=1 Tax=Phanerochaete carnosa (strain HHB-10118-sp) TaxID=650164 RepID=K5UIM6_PHACS|nr:uncharacterized protein PHACADRAFT_201749 [Phanerochaete carnosa HHB-10118-sp]EKM49361.1 hypothetical protein PHACADRAFT_201749 [Phanerochaete carnosa HHB-10118-sp]